MAPENLKPSDSIPRSNSFLSGREIIELPEPPKHGQCWGNWEFHQRRLTLRHHNVEVDLEKLITPTAFMNQVLRLAEMPLVSEEDLGNFARAMEQLLGPYTRFTRYGRWGKPIAEWTWSRQPRRRNVRGKT